MSRRHLSYPCLEFISGHYVILIEDQKAIILSLILLRTERAAKTPYSIIPSSNIHLPQLFNSIFIDKLYVLIRGFPKIGTARNVSRTAINDGYVDFETCRIQNHGTKTEKTDVTTQNCRCIGFCSERQRLSHPLQVRQPWDCIWDLQWGRWAKRSPRWRP